MDQSSPSFTDGVISRFTTATKKPIAKQITSTELQGVNFNFDVEKRKDFSSTGKTTLAFDAHLNAITPEPVTNVTGAKFVPLSTPAGITGTLDQKPIIYRTSWFFSRL